MADPLAYTRWDTDQVECDVCETTNTVTVYNDTRTGEWVREPFTCNRCDERHGEIDGRRDHGSGGIRFVLVTAGACLMTFALISAIGGHWGQALTCMSWGALFVGVPTVITLLSSTDLNRNEKD